MSGRNLGARIECGGELVRQIEAVALENAMNFASAQGFGELDWVEIRCGEGAPAMRYEGAFQLLSLHGRLRRASDVTVADYVCTVARHTDNGIQLLGGTLLAAGVKYVELSLSEMELAEFSEVSPSSSVQGDSGSDRIQTKLGSKPAKPVVSVAGDSRWAEAMAESSRVAGPASGASREQVRPARGDVVNHKQFGRCDVAKLGDDHVTLLKPDGRAVQLGLAVLEFVLEGEENGKRLFGVNVKPNR